MADNPLLTEEDHKLLPGLTDPWLSIFIDAANSAAARLAPCVTETGADSGLRAEAKLIVLRAIERVRGTPEYARSQTAGPFSITYITGGRGILDKDDRAALQDLCERTGAGSARGSFPEPDNYDPLFARPGRRGWW